jgi:hypothetical protein
MSGLSEVSCLIGQRARDIEKAREIFTAEIRAFVGGILSGVRRIRSDPWTTARLRLDLPRDIETEAKASSDFSSQFAVARTTVRFKKGTNFRQVADIKFGVEFDESSDVFAWQITLIPAASYNRLDDVVWHHWRGQPAGAPVGGKHQDKANTVRFISRAIAADLTAEIAYNDVKAVLEFLLSIENALAEPIGLEAAPGED